MADSNEVLEEKIKALRRELELDRDERKEDRLEDRGSIKLLWSTIVAAGAGVVSIAWWLIQKAIP